MNQDTCKRCGTVEAPWSGVFEQVDGALYCQNCLAYVRAEKAAREARRGKPTLRAAVAASLLLTACGSSGQSVTTAFDGSKPAYEAAIKARAHEANTLLGCPAFAFVEQAASGDCRRSSEQTDAVGTASCEVSAPRAADIEINWSTENAMASHFDEVAKHGALADAELAYNWTAVSDPSWLRVWVATDYPPAHGNLAPDDVARTWLIYVFWLRGLYRPSDDPQTLGFNHPTTNADPVGELVRELGGVKLARLYLCGGAE